MNQLNSLIEKCDLVSSMYAKNNSISREQDWYFFKLQEEMGELTKAYVNSKGLGRKTDKTPEQLQKDLTVRFGFDPSWLDQIFDLYNKTDLKRNNKEQVKQAFINSQVVASVWNDGNPIAIGRAISDFKMYSSIYDVVVDPEFQRRGLGKLVIKSLLERLEGTCVYLTSTFGNENFYKKLGFRFHKTDESGFAKRFSVLIGSAEHFIIVAKNQETIIAWMHLGIRRLLEDEDFAQLAAIVVKEEYRYLAISLC
jgi:ribosomal protein S18 acetylase RimI-like enzyme